MFLEERGFRFIELNYQPRLAGLLARSTAEDGITLAPAERGDRDMLCDMAGRVIRHGRWHQDPRIAPALADRRYRAWMANAFDHPKQSVLKCLLDGDIAAFLVVETPEPEHIHWSLVGLAPGLEGRGLGKRIWRAALHRHRHEGYDIVTTSISSHNVAAFNLYVSLGFRFPAPALTLQWCPLGPLD
jgi:ribosomal protein S18 acetylase RimI-like enzyme